MVAGENMRNIPFTYPTMKYPKVDYLQLKSYGLLVDNCPKDTVFINKPESFWKRYFWQIIISSIVLVAILFILGIFMIFQRKKMTYMASRNRMVDNMPICYMIGKLKTDKTGKLINIDFVSENHETSKLIPKHNALVPLAERRKINMKKRKNLGKKLVTVLVSVGFFIVAIIAASFKTFASSAPVNPAVSSDIVFKDTSSANFLSLL